MKLPRSLDELRDRRAARWTRESTKGQFDRFGPEAQREQQDRAIDALGVRDTGISWHVAHSGGTVDRTPEWADMLDRAGRDYDVLLVAYSSRFARNVEVFARSIRQLHEAGAAVYFCDERLLSADDTHWDWWMREAVEGESYRRRLSRRVQEGYAAKWRRLADPGGWAPLGFQRVEPQHVLAVDPATIGRAVALFERYASGMVSIEQLADEASMNYATVNDILKKPVYNGWVERKGERQPAAWRSKPPVDDATWERVQSLLARRSHGGGPRVEGRVDLLRGVLTCRCGTTVKANGTVRGVRRRGHGGKAGPCDQWTEQQWYPAETWERCVEAQMAGIRLTDSLAARIVAALTSPEAIPLSIDLARFERRKRDLALDHAAGNIEDAEYLEAMALLRREQAEASQDRSLQGVTADEAMAAIRSLAETWRDMLPEERARVIAATYQRITVRGREFIEAQLTPSAYAHGLALALPERVRIGNDVVRIPIAGAAEWRQAARKSA